MQHSSIQLTDSGESIDAGSTSLVGAMYDIDTGEVKFVE